LAREDNFVNDYTASLSDSARPSLASTSAATRPLADKDAADADSGQWPAADLSRVKQAGTIVRRVFSSPPLVAAFLGLVVGLSPPLQAYLLGPKAPLRALTGALTLCGKMQVPASMIMLSGAGSISAEKGDKRDKFVFSGGARATVLFARATCLGLCGFLWYHVCLKIGLCDERGLVPFLILLESTVPSAQNVVMLMLVHGDVRQGMAIAVMILEQYVVCIPFLTLHLVYFMILTEPFIPYLSSNP